MFPVNRRTLRIASGCMVVIGLLLGITPAPLGAAKGSDRKLDYYLQAQKSKAAAEGRPMRVIITTAHGRRAAVRAQLDERLQTVLGDHGASDAI